MATTNKSYTLEEIKELAAVLKHTPASTTPTAHPLHGLWPDGSNNAGIFAEPGVRPDYFSALPRPRSLAAILGLQPARTDHEKIGIMTGQLTDNGSNASDFCGNPPYPGNLKKCVHNYLWGKWFFKTALDVLPEMGKVLDYADVDKRVLNGALRTNPLLPDLAAGVNLGSTMGQRLATEFFKVGVAAERSFELTVVQGVQGGSTQSGWISEFTGIQGLITTGATDYDTGIACPAADSTVETFGVDISGTAADGRDVVQTMTDAYRGMYEIARQVGMQDTTWVWLMSHKAFVALSQVWACGYYTARCQTGTAGQPVPRDAMSIRELEIQMYNGQYLLIDGMRIPVIISDGIPEVNVNGSNQWTSDVFLLPISWMGRRLLNLQYLPMNSADINDFAAFMGTGRIQTANNGLYLIGERDNGFCTEILFAMQARLIQDAPFLAYRLDDLLYNFYEPARSAYAANTYDYVDGGASGYVAGQYAG